MTDKPIANTKIENETAIISFNVASLPSGPDLDQVAQQILELIETGQSRNIIMDFSGVKFFSSQTLGIILEARKKLSDSNGKVAICGIDPQLHRVFKITNLDKIFVFFQSVADAADYMMSDNK